MLFRSQEVLGAVMKDFEPRNLSAWLDDNYVGYYDDLKDLGYEHVEMMGGLKNLSENELEYNFDYESYGRDLAQDYYEFDGYYFRNYAKGGMMKKYAKGGGVSSKPKMVRSIFEEEEFEYAGGGSIGADHPAVYVADLAAYNEGKLVGEWIDLSKFGSGRDVMLKIDELMKQWSKEAGEKREEFAIHDFENFSRDLYSEHMGESDFDTIIEIYDISQERDIPQEVLGEIGRAHV